MAEKLKPGEYSRKRVISQIVIPVHELTRYRNSKDMVHASIDIPPSSLTERAITQHMSDLVRSIYLRLSTPNGERGWNKLIRKKAEITIQITVEDF